MAVVLTADPLVDELPIRLSSGDRAALFIRRLVFEGRLRSGDRVPQAEVAAALGMSRIPVREALIVLEREGWVTLEPHRGAFVNGFDERGVRDHYALFALLYGTAARHALAREPHLSSRLETLVKQLKVAEDPTDVARLTLAFHETIIDAAQMPRLWVLLGALPGLIPGNFFKWVPGSIEVEKKGLLAIARAIRADDPDGAVAGYEDMLGRQGDLVVTLFKARGFFEGPAGTAS